MLTHGRAPPTGGPRNAIPNQLLSVLDLMALPVDGFIMVKHFIKIFWSLDSWYGSNVRYALRRRDKCTVEVPIMFIQRP